MRRSATRRTATAGDAPGTTSVRRPGQGSGTDGEIHQDVLDVLTLAGLPRADVTVAVRDGVVTLDGVLGRPGDVPRVLRQAWRVDGGRRRRGRAEIRRCPRGAGPPGPAGWRPVRPRSGSIGSWGAHRVRARLLVRAGPVPAPAPPVLCGSRSRRRRHPS
ncbi:BON domain-containing protein [Streptomyces sp. NPDC059063]|uniref:BON domain-containing protein n=1 Tax=unclassified Streptomyces TaxID=2593676 RepID=UPI00367FA62D